MVSGRSPESSRVVKKQKREAELRPKLTQERTVESEVSQRPIINTLMDHQMDTYDPSL